MPTRSRSAWSAARTTRRMRSSVLVAGTTETPNWRAVSGPRAAMGRRYYAEGEAPQPLEGDRGLPQVRRRVRYRAIAGDGDGVSTWSPLWALTRHSAQCGGPADGHRPHVVRRSG